jgi:hypothetical protein
MLGCDETGFAILVPNNPFDMVDLNRARIAGENLIFFDEISWLISYLCAVV